mmetsp:Transcript_21478/g.24783  ORF Transcript_21478/g.24783 Transcript_21478/m.24783 type:complete len:301 (-) Transcript_21478:69-971(-)
MILLRWEELTNSVPTVLKFLAILLQLNAENQVQLLLDLSSQVPLRQMYPQRVVLQVIVPQDYQVHPHPEHQRVAQVIFLRITHQEIQQEDQQLRLQVALVHHQALCLQAVQVTHQLILLQAAQVIHRQVYLRAAQVIHLLIHQPEDQRVAQVEVQVEVQPELQVQVLLEHLLVVLLNHQVASHLHHPVMIQVDLLVILLQVVSSLHQLQVIVPLIVMLLLPHLQINHQEILQEDQLPHLQVVLQVALQVAQALHQVHRLQVVQPLHQVLLLQATQVHHRQVDQVELQVPHLVHHHLINLL